MSSRISIPIPGQDDKKLTEVMLKRADKGDHYECWKPGCGFKTTDQEEFVRHFQTHIDEFLAGSWN